MTSWFSQTSDGKVAFPLIINAGNTPEALAGLQILPPIEL
jgi:hypothetical protein